MSGPTNVIVLEPDERAGRQVQLGFEREGVSTAIPAIPADLGQLTFDFDGAPGLVVVGGRSGRAIELVQRARSILAEKNLDVPVIVAARGAGRAELEAAGADEVLAQPLYLRDIVTVARILRGVPASRCDHIVGSLVETTGVYTLVRALASLGRSAVLTLIRGLRRGEVRFYRGEVTSAEVGLIHGQAAFHQLLLWTDARFDFAHEDIVRRQQIPLAPDELFADAERFLEGVRESAGRLSPATVLEQNVVRIQELGKQIPTEVHGVLRMFDGHRVLTDILEDSPYRVFETLRVAQKAVEVGLLRAVDSQRPKATWRAVLAIDEWLVGNETREAVVERTASIGESEPVAAGKRKGKGKSKARSKRAATPAVGVKTEIDWGALVPRVIGAEVGPLSGVVPAQAAAGEVDVSSRDRAREKLEALMDTGKRDRIFPTDIGLEPKVVIDGDTGEVEKQSSGVVAANEPETVGSGKNRKKKAERKAQQEAKAAAAKAAAEKAAADKVAAERAAAEKIAADKVAAEKVAAAAAEKLATERAAAEKIAADKVAAEKVAAAAAEKLATERAATEKATADAAAQKAAAEKAAADKVATERAAAEKATADAAAQKAAAEKAATDNAAAERAAAEKAATDAAAEKAAAQNAAAEKAAIEEAAAEKEAREAAAAQKDQAEKIAAMQAAADRIAAERAEAQKAAAAKPDAAGAAAGAMPDAARAGAVPGSARGADAADATAAPDAARAAGAMPDAASDAHLTDDAPRKDTVLQAAHAFPRDRPAGTDAKELVRRLVADALPPAADGTPTGGRDNPSAAVTSPVRATDDLATRPFVRPEADDALRAHIAEPVTVSEARGTSVAVADVLTVKVTPDDTAHLTASPRTLISETPAAGRIASTTPSVARIEVPKIISPIHASAAPVATEDDPSDGIIRSSFTGPDSDERRARARLLQPPSLKPEHDGPAIKETTGEIGSRAPRSGPLAEPSTSEPSILVADLAAAHSAIAAVVAKPAVSPPPPADAASPSRELEVSQTRRDAVAFSEDEEEFFKRAESHTHTVPKVGADSFEDLDEGYEPTTFWGRVFGKNKKK